MTKRCGFIALAGRPNAGKSTFLNHVLSEKVSIVSDKPQTTRNRILGVYHGEDLQIGFFDLPGIHKPRFKMNNQMMRSVSNGLDDADLIFHFIDASVPSGSGDRYVHEFLKKRELPVILVVNKMDLVNKSKAILTLTRLHDEFSPNELVPISAETGENVDKLLEVCANYLPEGDFLFEQDELTNQSLRFMACEFIREKLLHFTRDEIPHAVAVTIERFQVNEEQDRYEIDAVIWVEKKTQRKIILGSKGQMIQKIAQSSRRSLKKLLEKPVQLELYVKVEEKWRDKENILADLNPSNE